MDKIRVAIADDNELSREMLRVITELDDSLEIVGEAENGIEAWALVKEEKPDILLLDVVMPRGDGLEVLAKAREEGNIDTKFIMVSAVGDAYGSGCYGQRCRLLYREAVSCRGYHT